MNGEAGPLNLRQRQLVLCALLIPHLHSSAVGRVFCTDNFDFHVTADRCEARTFHCGAPSYEPPPVLERLQRPFYARRRNFQHITPRNEPGILIQLQLERPRCTLAIANLHLRSIKPINPDIQDGARFAAADTEVHKLISKFRNFLRYNAFQPVSHRVSTPSKGTKKRGEDFPHAQRTKATSR